MNRKKAASGNSKNLVNCVDDVKKNNGISIGFFGFDVEKILETRDIFLHNQGENKDYGPI